MGTWIFLLLVPFSAMASPLSASPEWQQLLHYRPSIIGPKSTADGPDFFLSPQGKVDPAAELEATLAAFRAGAQAKPVGPLKQIPLCAFPARRQFLEARVGEKFPVVTCAEYQDWKRGLDAAQATFVFSSAYPNNPAAMFGHTLLRLDRAQSAGRMNLLNYGVAFSANVPSGIDDFRYSLYGLLGGFSGFFSLAPYYTMANDYTNSEIRDLWEYPLRLTPAQINVLVDHLWELYTTTFFDYYFFTENCTTQLLALLQVALPDKDLFRGMPWYILPIDSIHQLKKLGLLENPLHRPSVKKKLTAAIATLSREEKKELHSLLDGKTSLSSANNPAVLDAAAAYWNYKKFLGKKLTDSPAQQELHRVLLHRATLGRTPSRPTSFDETNRPDLGHYSSSAGLGYAYREKESRLHLNYKLGMHSLLNGSLGFEPSAQIDLPSFALSYLPQRKKFRLEEFQLFEIVSLFPWDTFDKKLSWKFGARLETMRKINCDTCHRGLVEGGAGVATQIFGEKDLWYSLALARTAYSTRTRWDLGLGSESGLLFRFTPRHAFQLAARGEWDFRRSFQQATFWTFSYAQAYTWSQRWEARAQFEFVPRRSKDETSASSKLTHFF